MIERHEYPRTCRLCGGRNWRWELLKYGTRNYAHFACFAEHKTIADLEQLPAAPRREFERWREREQGR